MSLPACELNGPRNEFRVSVPYNSAQATPYSAGLEVSEEMKSENRKRTVMPEDRGAEPPVHLEMHLGRDLQRTRQIRVRHRMSRGRNAVELDFEKP
jgi:hypothetical protein